MRQHHALRLPGAAGGVLQEADLPAAAAHRGETFAIGGEIGRHEHRAQRFHLRPQKPGDRLRFRDRHHERGLGALQDADVAREVVLDRRQARRRVERHGNAAREQRAVEAK